jgi:predicted small secreted protein
MMHTKRFLVLLTVAAALTACKKEEGPAERAGRQLDQAVQEAGKQIEKAGEKIQDAAKK